MILPTDSTRAEIAEFACMLRRAGRPDPKKAKVLANMRRWIIENGYKFCWEVDSGTSVLYPTQRCRLVRWKAEVAVRNKIDFSRYANQIKPLVEAELALEWSLDGLTDFSLEAEQTLEYYQIPR